MSMENKYKYLEDDFGDILGKISKHIQKAKISQRFDAINLSEEENEFLIKAKEICEIQINSLWHQRSSNEFLSYCLSYFDISSYFDYEIRNENDILEIFKIIIFGYLSEHSHFVRNFVISKINIDTVPVPDKWNLRLLYSIFKSVLYLIKKDNWKDISNVVDSINNLRSEQRKFEHNYLNQVREESQSYGVTELVSLYHFAKVVDILASYLLEGNPNDAENKIEYHFRVASEFAEISQNISLFLLYKYFKEFAIKLIRNTIWYNLKGVNHLVSMFNKFTTKKESGGIFELLYPQKHSLREGLLNPDKRSIVITLPTSSGKTLIAEYKILQALNNFKQRGGWVAYLVPTKSLINQVYSRLKQDFESLDLKVEKASGSIEIDGFEVGLVENKGDNTNFDVLVTTYEKMNLLVRQGLGTTDKRQLVLSIVDEAHNIGDSSRGLNLEMLLSTIKNDCSEVNFLLLTPDIPNSEEITEWLGGERGKVINLELDWWQPNERIIGALLLHGRGRNYDITLKTLNTTKGSFVIGEDIPIVNIENANENKSQLNSKIKISQLVTSKILNENFPIIVLAAEIGETFKIAEYLFENCQESFESDDEVELIRRFVRAELGDDFPLAKYLGKRIAIHHSAIPDEIRQLIEILMEKGKLKVLVATTTIAQGINFPVSTVIMGSYIYPFCGPMPTRDFWNMAGRVGRVGQESIGLVGISCRNEKDIRETAEYVQKATKVLLSQLEDIVNDLEQNSNAEFSSLLFRDERWSAILQYVSHLKTQITDLQEFINKLEQKLSDTLGYRQISNDKRKLLFRKLEEYAKSLSLQYAKWTDSTGFSTISVEQMIRNLNKTNLSIEQWKKEQLFSEQNQTLKNLVGIMLNTYEIKKPLEEIKIGNTSLDRNSLSRLIIYWVNGYKIPEIAKKLFVREEDSKAIELTSKALYKTITTFASWGISAIQKMPASGIDWEKMTEQEKKNLLNIPAYIYYGVNTDESVLMRKANVPRSIAKEVGEKYRQKFKDFYKHTTSEVLNCLKQRSFWTKIVPENSPLNEDEYFAIWKKLNYLE
ncbi:MAG TPA: DEAD/DEAH box helicase [Candidatus Hydrogenedens sp.]|nr:DEAD/DEAH box helicase [Candidatus Hydrogenedens sp.]